MTGLVDTSGRPIELGTLLAKGGEGAVYPVVGRPDTLAKIYTTPPDAERVDKIVAMSARNRPEAEYVCAWPRGLIFKNGVPLGLLMKRFDERKELHILLGPKSRKMNFPDASFAFLIHVALNVARAVAWLHDQKVYIGDLNDRGILIASNGTARLIDCDSFQFMDGSRVFGCDVGVPEYTAPELQGRSLRGLVRTADHDRFALAVIIFRILFMGRHPFAGSFQGGNKEIHEAIAESRYVYSGSSHNQMIPPPNMLPIDQGAGSKIQALFETAFSRKAAQSIGGGRPAATTWIGALADLRQDLVDCPFNAAHQFVKGPRSCPWCELELRTNIDFFNFISALGDDEQIPDIDAIWQAIGTLQVPRIPSLSDLNSATVAPRPLSEDKLRLRTELNEARHEAARSASILKAATNDEDEAHRALELFVAQSSSNTVVADLERRLRRVNSPEKVRFEHRLLYILGAGTLYFGAATQSRALQALGVFAIVAPKSVDFLVRRVRSHLAQTLPQKIAFQRRRAIQLTKELAEQLSVLDAKLMEAQKKRETAKVVHEGLLHAAGHAQRAFDECVQEERDRLERELRTAEVAYRAHAAGLEALNAETNKLQVRLEQRRVWLLLSRNQATQLREQRDNELKKLRDDDREQQLQGYLDQHYIATAAIAGITPALKSALASYEIETAADIQKLTNLKVPGFGTVRVHRMFAWRRSVAAAFRYSPSQAVDPAKLRAVEQRYRAGVQRLAGDLTNTFREFDDLIKAAKSNADDALKELRRQAVNCAQIKADLDALK